MEVAIIEDVTRALSLMEQVMRGGEALAQDYPLVFGRNHAGRAAIALESGEVVSGCALLERELVHEDARLRAGLIGSVSTSPQHRGRGLATAVLERAEQEFLADGCLLALLWAEDPTFYAKRNYQSIGAETDFVLTQELATLLPEAGGVRRATKADQSAMHALYRGHRRRAERSLAESQALFDTPGARLVVHEQNGRIDGYACLGCGVDLGGVVHEWAGERDAVLACVRSFLEDRDDIERETPLYLMAPVPAEEVGERLADLGAPWQPGILGMAKLLDEAGAVERIVGAAEETIRAERREAGGWRLEGPTGALELERSELLEVLLSPRGDRRSVARVEEALGARFPELPWTPFLWGLDSI